MLKRQQSFYHAGRSRDLLKMKLRQTALARVVGYIAGKGRFKGKVGALEVQMKEGATFKIGSGLKDSDRQHPPALGSMVQFEYQG